MSRGLLALAVLLLLPTWALWIEPSSLTIAKESLTPPGWQAPPLRVALLADLHIGSPHMDVAHLHEIVDATLAAGPDLILLLGDFCINEIPGGAAIPLSEWTPELTRLTAPLGVYAVLGNHDWWNQGEEVAAAIESVGVPVIDNEAVDLGAFWLVGMGDWTTGHHAPEQALHGVPDNATVLGMTHNPDLFDTLDDRVDLLVAGHSHGGQVDLPFLGTPVVPARYVRGYYEAEGRGLFVSSGVGTSIFPVRFRVPPEIALVTIGG